MVSKFKFKTSSAKEVRVTLSKIVNLVANDELDPKKANSIVYVCNAILQSIRTDIQEKEIQELRELVEEIQKEADKDEKWY